MYIFWGVLGWSRLKDLDLYEDPGGPGVEQMEDSRGVVATEPLENIFKYDPNVICVFFF